MAAIDDEPTWEMVGWLTGELLEGQADPRRWQGCTQRDSVDRMG